MAASQNGCEHAEGSPGHHIHSLHAMLQRKKEAHQAKNKPGLQYSHPFLHFVHALFESNYYDAAVATIVAVNVVLIVIETDCDAVGRTVPGWVNIANNVILCVFASECCIKVSIYQRSFFKSLWNIFDATIVSVDIISFILGSVMSADMPGLSMLRIVRLIRLGRSVQFLMLFPELGLMLTSILGTIKSLAWGFVLLMVFLALFAILAVQLVHPVNQEVTALGLHEGCERCPRAFESVWQAMLTFFQQLIAGDSWGQVSLAISERSPACWMFFILVLSSMQLLLLNVILAAVVDNAQQARLENADIVAKQKDAERKHLCKSLKNLCKDLDVDSNGSLTLPEILEGFNNSNEFYNIMDAMDVHPEDIAFVWEVLDPEQSGFVIYDQFAEELFKLKMADSHTVIVFIKHQVAKITRALQEQNLMFKSTSKAVEKVTVIPHDEFGTLSSEAGETNCDPSAPETVTKLGGLAKGLPQDEVCSELHDAGENNIPANRVGNLDLTAHFDKLKDELSTSLMAALRQIEDKIEVTTRQIASLSEADQNRCRENGRDYHRLASAPQQGFQRQTVPWGGWPMRCCQNTPQQPQVHNLDDQRPSVGDNCECPPLPHPPQISPGHQLPDLASWEPPSSQRVGPLTPGN